MNKINLSDSSSIRPSAEPKLDGWDWVLMFLFFSLIDLSFGALYYVFEVGLTEAWDRHPVVVLLAAVPVGLVLAALATEQGKEEKKDEKDENPFARDWSGFHVTGGYGDGEGEEGDCGNDSFGDVGFGDCGD